MSTNTVVSRIIKTEGVKWRKLTFLQSADFKELTEEDEAKLRQSIIDNQFSEPFYVWEDGKILYCLDGYHRSKVLHKLAEEGVNIPEELPATFIRCENKQEAAKLVLQYSSQYAKTTYPGILSFIEQYDLGLQEMNTMFNIPDINIDALVADMGKDFGSLNRELDIETFQDEIVMKLTFSKADYLHVKERIQVFVAEKRLSSAEELIKVLLG